MAHIRHVNDSEGDLVDLIYFCSDFCNRGHYPNGVAAEGLEPYGGWYGLVELEYDEECASCGEVIEGSHLEVTDG